jgi:hypothetical protein
VNVAGFLFFWAVLLSLVFAVPYALASPTLADDLTRNTVRLALVYYVLAINLLLRMRREHWSSMNRRVVWARRCWTLAWLTYVIHVAVAFHFYHHWSHADAIRHTEEVSGFGPGIYLSHLFTLLWTTDVIFWWKQPERYACRSRWIDGALHGFMFFIIFNGTVVYEEGPIRWAGILVTGEFVVLLVLNYYRAPA